MDLCSLERCIQACDTLFLESWKRMKINFWVILDFLKDVTQQNVFFTVAYQCLSALFTAAATYYFRWFLYGSLCIIEWIFSGKQTAMLGDDESLFGIDIQSVCLISVSFTFCHVDDNPSDL